MKAKPSKPLLFFYVLIAVAAVLLLMLASAARAETRCAGLTDALAALEAKYGEKLIWQGLSRDGQRLLVTANPDGSTWTAMIQADGSKVCFASSGESWAPGGAMPAPQGTEG